MTPEILENDMIRVTIDAAEMSAGVELKPGKQAWHFAQNLDGDVWVTHGQTEAVAHLREAPRKTVRRVRTPREERVTVFLEGLPGGTGVSVTFAVPSRGAILWVEVEPLPTGSSSAVREARFPGPLNFVNAEPRYTVWPNAAGMLLPNTYGKAIAPEGEGLAGRMGFNRSLYQPWWGVVAKQGAYAAIAETPFDFALDIRHPAGGPTSTRPAWLPSLGHLAYPRIIRYAFFESADHVVLAKAYRGYSQSIGRWVALQEKFDSSPNVHRLIGCVAFPVSICSHNCRERPASRHVVSFADRERQVRRLKSALGRDEVYLHIDGWGYRGYDNHHPYIFPPCPEAGGWDGLIALSRAADECGYLFGLHDQYRDYYLDGPRFTETRAIKDADGKLPQWSRWAGGPQSVLCAKEALADIRHNFTELLGRGVRLTASYLDVFAIVPMDECHDARHPMTREDCCRWRAEGLDAVRDFGIVISSEEPVDCFIPHLDFAHWADYPREGFMKGDYLGVPVPIHSLVYHDALLLPAVFEYGANDADRARHFLEGLARVEIPYGRIDWSRPEDFRDVDILARLHGVWGTSELVDHRVLDADGLVQEFEYPDGKVTIDLKELRYRIEGGPEQTRDWTQAPTQHP